MRRLLTYLLCLLALPALAAEWDLGPKRWEVTSDAAEIDEDTGAWMIDLSDFPASFWETANLPDSIRTTSSDADTQVPVHIIGFDDDGSTGTGWLWVGDGVSAASSDTVWVYAGDTGATMPARDSTYGSEAAYDANVAAAWWFDGGSLVDSTDAEITLTNMNTATATTGPVAGLSGYSFSAGSSQYLRTTSMPLTDIPAQIDSWSYTADGLEHCPVSLGTSASNSQSLLTYYVRANITNDPTVVLVYGGSGSALSAIATNTHPFDQWVYAPISRDATTGTTTLDRNGSVTTNATTIASGTAYNQFAIGAMWRTSASLYWTGSVGPVMVHSTVRSANYNATIRNMILNPGAVYTIGTMEEEPATGDGETDWIELTSVASSTGWTNPTQALTSLANAATDDIPAGTNSGALNLVNLADALSELTGEPITGIAVEIIATGEDASTRELIDYTIRLIIGGTVVGDNKAIATKWTDTAQVTRIYGGAGDLWGVTPDDTDVQGDTFGVSLAFEDIGPSLDSLMSVFRVRMKIYYGAGTTDTTSFFAFFD